jgi:hypothetical protein
MRASIRSFMSPARLLKGDTRIKSGYDGKRVTAEALSQGKVLSALCECPWGLIRVSPARIESQ